MATRKQKEVSEDTTHQINEYIRDEVIRPI